MLDKENSSLPKGGATDFEEHKNATTKAIPLRKISSLDNSDLYSSVDEKKAALIHRRPKIFIPKYSERTPKYRNSLIKRFYSRIRYFSAILRQKASRTEYPLIAVLVVNNKCNWNCSYCFGDYPNRKEIDYSTDEIKFIVDELHAMGVRYLNVHGGETLLREDIGEICNYIKQKGIYLCLITNGSLLAKKIDEIRNVDNLTISLDGRPSNNDKNRGNGSFAKAMQAIELAIAEKIPLRVSVTLTRHTMRDIEYLANLAHEKNFHLYFSILFKPLKKAKDAQMSQDEIRACIQEIRKYRDLGFPIFTSDRSLDATYHWPFDFNEKYHVTEAEIPASYQKHHVPCYFSRTKFTVEADGYVYPCFLTTDGSFQPLNWRDVGIRRAIEHVRNQNTCRACPAMSHNDHSLLLGLNWQQVAYMLKDQWKEVFRLRNRVAAVAETRPTLQPKAEESNEENSYAKNTRLPLVELKAGD